MTMRKNLIHIGSLFLCVVVGVGVGILFAPVRGIHVRNMLSYRIKSCVEKLQELIKTLSHARANVSSQAKVASQKVIDETIYKAQQLLQEANELAAQLEQ